MLAGAVRDGVVTPQQADLISGIHLDQVHRGRAGTKLGLSRNQMGLELATAERKLIDYLAAA